MLTLQRGPLEPSRDRACKSAPRPPCRRLRPCRGSSELPGMPCAPIPHCSWQAGHCLSPSPVSAKTQQARQLEDTCLSPGFQNCCPVCQQTLVAGASAGARGIYKADRAQQTQAHATPWPSGDGCGGALGGTSGAGAQDGEGSQAARETTLHMTGSSQAPARKPGSGMARGKVTPALTV